MSDKDLRAHLALEAQQEAILEKHRLRLLGDVQALPAGVDRPDEWMIAMTPDEIAAELQRVKSLVALDAETNKPAGP
jgi:hypothetical protein